MENAVPPSLEVALTALAALAVAFLPFALVRVAQTFDRRTWWLFVGVLAVALTARTLVPHRLVMIYFGYEHIGEAVELGHLPRYGPGATVLWWLLFRVAPRDHTSVQWLHVVLGTLTAGLFAAYVQRVGRSLLGAAGAGLVLALAPLFLRDHGSESMAVPAMFAFALAAHLALEVVDRFRAPGATGGGATTAAIGLVAATVFGASCRPDLLVAAVPLILAFALAAHPPRDVLRAVLACWPWAVALLLLLVPLVVASYLNTQHELARGSLPRLARDGVATHIFHSFQEANVLFDPRVFPVVLWAPVLLGALAGPGARRAWWLVGAAVLALLPTYLDWNEVSILRLQVPAATLVVTAAGLGLAALSSRGRPGQAAAVAFLGGALALAYPSLEPLTQPRNPDQEDALIRRSLRALEAQPGAKRLHHFRDQDVEMHGMYLHFPDYLFTERGVEVAGLRPLTRDHHQSDSPEPARYFLRSLRCYLWPPFEPGAEKAGTEHPICSEVCQRFECQPVFEEQVANLGDWSYFDGYGKTDTLKVGLYRLSPPPLRQAERRIDPLHARFTAFMEAAWTLSGQKRYTEALALYIQAARINPRGKPVMSRIVATLSPHMFQPSEARPFVELADKHPEDSLIQFVGGVAAHYAAHNGAHTREEKTELYRTTLRILPKALGAFPFEPRLQIYLGVSNFRLGNQALALKYIDEAVRLGQDDDPDAYYCRAEINQFTNIPKALQDIERYLAITRKHIAEGTLLDQRKQNRVHHMYEVLKARQRGERHDEELFDPLLPGGP